MLRRNKWIEGSTQSVLSGVSSLAYGTTRATLRAYNGPSSIGRRRRGFPGLRAPDSLRGQRRRRKSTLETYSTLPDPANSRSTMQPYAL